MIEVPERLKEAGVSLRVMGAGNFVLRVSKVFCGFPLSWVELSARRQITAIAETAIDQINEKCGCNLAIVPSRKDVYVEPKRITIDFWVTSLISTIERPPRADRGQREQADEGRREKSKIISFPKSKARP